MLIVNTRSFARGFVLMISFMAVFTLILMPIYPGERSKLTGLDYADNLFNRLSKGSSWFIPEIAPRVRDMQGKTIEVTVQLKKAASADAVVRLFTASGAAASAEGGLVRVMADLGTLLGAVLADCEAVYHDKPEPVAAKYGMDGGKALAFWWEGLQPMIKELQKMKCIAEAQAVDLVLRKGIEPAYNFQGIAAGSVKQEFVLLLALLVFYVLYTLWYGFAIFNILEGIGLTMKKGKKQEV
jgi:hypothetical protein